MVGVEKLVDAYSARDPTSPSGQHRPDQRTVAAACSSRGNITGYSMSRSGLDVSQNPRNAPLRVPPAPKLTNFFIEDILHPDFGSRRDKKPDIESARGETDCSQNVTSNEGRARGGSVSSSEEGMSSPGAPENTSGSKVNLWPAWVYCTRYSDRPSAGPRSRKIKRREKKPEEKRPRTAFTNEQLSHLRKEFDTNRYLTEQRRQELSRELKLNESQIKIWFQNKRAKLKKAGGISTNRLALHLMAQGLYNHAANSGDER